VLDEVVKDSAMLFELIKTVLGRLPVAWMKLMEQATKAGLDLKEISKKRTCPNSQKARTTKKKEQLDWAAAVLELFPNALELLAKEGFSLFSSGRGCRLLRTQSSDCMLF
jgi:hypothetical protein